MIYKRNVDNCDWHEMCNHGLHVVCVRVKMVDSRRGICCAERQHARRLREHVRPRRGNHRDVWMGRDETRRIRPAEPRVGFDYGDFRPRDEREGGSRCFLTAIIILPLPLPLPPPRRPPFPKPRKTIKQSWPIPLITCDCLDRRNTHHNR